MNQDRRAAVIWLLAAACGAVHSARYPANPPLPVPPTTGSITRSYPTLFHVTEATPAEPFGVPSELRAYPITLPVLGAAERAERVETLRSLLSGFEIRSINVDAVGFFHIELGAAPADRDPESRDDRVVPADAPDVWRDYVGTARERSIAPAWPYFLYTLRSVLGSPNPKWNAHDRLFKVYSPGIDVKVACGLGDALPTCVIAPDRGTGWSLQAGFDSYWLATRLANRSAAVRARAAAGRRYELIRTRQAYRKISDYSGCSDAVNQPCDQSPFPELEPEGKPWVVTEKRAATADDFELGWALEVECHDRIVTVRVVARATLAVHLGYEQWTDSHTLVRESYESRGLAPIVVDAVDGTIRAPDAQLNGIDLAMGPAYSEQSLGCAAAL
jgi:hypothetical protein